MTPELIAIIGAVTGIIGAIAGMAAATIAVVQFGYPAWKERKNRLLLEEKLSRGPYSKEIIENATRYYIRPKCSNIDPAQEQEARGALIATREDLFEVMNRFLDDSIHRHLLILADSGMGKTSFLLNYYAYNSQYRWRKRHHLFLVPLGRKDADEIINNITGKEEMVVFLDALDEDINAIEDHNKRITYLMDICKDFKKVVITCRTQFFLKDEEIPVKTGVLRIGPRASGESAEYEFWKLYLSPFDDDQVKSYIKKRYPLWHYKSRRKALEIALNIPLLSPRPMLLGYIPDLIKTGNATNRISQLYKIMVDAWIDREDRWADKEALRDLSERLAIDLYKNRSTRGSEGVSYKELQALAQSWDIKLEPWKVSGRSLLNRDAEGIYKFAHRSIMEYLFVTKLVMNTNDDFVGIILTDEMKRFLIDILIDKDPDISVLTYFLLYVELEIESNKQDQQENIFSLIDEETQGFIQRLYFSAFLDFVQTHKVDFNEIIWDIKDNTVIVNAEGSLLAQDEKIVASSIDRKHYQFEKVAKEQFEIIISLTVKEHPALDTFQENFLL